MNLPKIWSGGQLFAFSALDGESYASDDFTGILSEDKIGIRFFTKIKRELIIVNESRLKYTFNAVTSDYISVNFDNKGYAKIVYADTHLVVGKAENCYALSLVEGECENAFEKDILIQDTKDGQFTAFYKKDGFFAFAYAKSREDVVKRIKKSKCIDIDRVVESKLDFFEKHGKTDGEFADLYNKCLSTMKTQLYSPEGFFGGIWSTPDRLPHKMLWLWDSVFHAIGFRNVDTDLAQTLISDIFDVQEADGFIPHYASCNYHSNITQPPVIAWGAYKVYRKSKDKQFLSFVFKKNRMFLEWCQSNRRITEKQLYTWNTKGDVNCRCDESGMDNSPRFDIHERLYAIDYSCFMANEMRYMMLIADELGDSESAKYFENWRNSIVNDINETLWCKEDGFYYDYVINKNSFHKVSSVASFLPIFSGVASKEQADLLVKELKNPETFYTEFPIPSISKKDATFGSDMWRGPVWINYNYMISEGLKFYGYDAFADEIINKTVKTLDYWYRKKGTMFEFYDSENKNSPNELNRKGEPLVPYDFTVKAQAIREYGWSTTLLLDLIHNEIK